MCEEFPRASTFGAKDGFDRRVVRVITPGTLIDEPFLNQYENNYLLSINPSEQPLRTGGAAEQCAENTVGLAWIDVSTGDFFAKSSTYQNLRDDLARISPREIVLDKELELDAAHPIRQALAEERNFVSYITPTETTIPSSCQECTDDLTDEHEATSIPLPTFTSQETSAIKLLTTFLHANLLEHMPRLSLPRREANEGRMQIDSHTIKALEIREGIREGGTSGSLLSVVKRTVTSSGTRLLGRWLCKYNNVICR